MAWIKFSTGETETEYKTGRGSGISATNYKLLQN